MNEDITKVCRDRTPPVFQEENSEGKKFCKITSTNDCKYHSTETVRLGRWLQYKVCKYET